MTLTPQCFDCKHFDRSASPRFVCPAFPDGDGIPDEILLNDHDHHDAFPGDHDVRFEPIADEPDAT